MISWVERYKSLHLWMIIPMIIMQLGIFKDYWGDFRENAWSVHIHYWTGTVWYLFLISQPYFATHGQMPRHRTYGIIGMFIGGAVCLTALSMLHRDIQTTENIIANPERFGPFKTWFFFAVAAVEIVMMIAFGYAVIKSIIHRKEVENHSWWLISTVFLIMMPALARGLQFAAIGLVYGGRVTAEVDIMSPVYLSQLLIIVMIVAAAWKLGTLKHQATYLAVGVNLFVLMLEPLGRSASVEAFLKAVIKG